MKWCSMDSERGHSLIETVLLGLLFLVPLVWLLGTLSEIHVAALATTNAAREAGFEATRTSDHASAQEAVEHTVDQAFRNHGLRPELAEVSMSSPIAFGRGRSIEITVAYPVSVLRAPFLGDVSFASVSVEAQHVARVDPYRSHP